MFAFFRSNCCSAPRSHYFCATLQAAQKNPLQHPQLCQRIGSPQMPNVNWIPLHLFSYRDGNCSHLPCHYSHLRIDFCGIFELICRGMQIPSRFFIFIVFTFCFILFFLNFFFEFPCTKLITKNPCSWGMKKLHVTSKRMW